MPLSHFLFILKEDLKHISISVGMKLIYKHMPRRKKQPPQAFLPNIYRHIAIGFVALAVILIGIIVFFSLISAKVEVTPRKTLQSVEFLASVGPEGQAEVIPGRLDIRVIEGEEMIEATGSKEIEQRAEGKAIIISKANFPQPLVATTRLLSSEGVLFRLKESVTVPVQGRVEVSVYADKLGASGNIEPSRFSIPGLTQAKQELIWAESEKPMTDGVKVLRVVSSEDIERAKSIILQKLEQEAMEKYMEEISSESFDALLKIFSSEATVGAKAGEERQNFSVKGRFRAGFVAFNRQILAEMAKTRLLANLSLDKELISFDGKTMILKIESFNETDDGALLRVYADGEVILKKTSPVLNVEKIAGMRFEDAKKYLESFESVESVKITVFPAWLKNIPTLKDHIEIVIKK